MGYGQSSVVRWREECCQGEIERSMVREGGVWSVGGGVWLGGGRSVVRARDREEFGQGRGSVVSGRWSVVRWREECCQSER